MNSYPHEFLAHPQPLMFVAGLTTTSNTTRDRSASIISTSGTRRTSGGASTLLEASGSGSGQATALTTPITSPSVTNEQLPSSPPVEGGPSSLPLPVTLPGDQGLAPAFGQGDSITPINEADREFEELVTNLRGALTTKGGKGKVWLGENERRDFRILLVDKGVRLPMRKVNPNTGASTSTPSLADAPSTPHSPLSPLTTSSPLYPDGLIAPVWIRKHAELVPSVFVLFLRLYESPPVGPDTAENADEKQRREADEKAKEKEMDDKLVGEIGERRRRLGERGIKLTVVLMASSATLDSPALDPRLSYLRRASALSSKASLFVLTPVPADQLPDFVQSLQDALYDSAIEYYSTHAKRVRRKRSRVPASQPIAAGGSKALGPQGWAVRYDWKSGWFAEVRGELDAASRHYEDCWNELARMFASTTTLPPRTKRWAEAKVLADCVAVRICKLILYENEPARVLNPFFVHLKRFGDLSRGWGIGEDTFEFWSWIARQYRIFAELLEMAEQAGLPIPPMVLPTFPSAATAAAPSPDFYTTPISSIDPRQVLHPPAYYFYTAATCSIERKKRFELALNGEVSAEASAVTAPGFANEKKVDHAALIAELLSKAYSLLKEQDPAQNRVALYVAFRIAEIHCLSDQHEMAMKFFDRISSSFKREKWSEIVRQIRKLWYECAQRTGNVDCAARLLVEMMCPQSGVEGDERSSLQEDLLSLLKTTAPASQDPIIVDLEGENALLDVRAGFWLSESTVGQSVPFQITLRCPESVNVSQLTFTSLRISYADDREDTVIESTTDDSKADGNIKVVDIKGPSPAPASLRWTPGKIVVLNGELDNKTEGNVAISALQLAWKQGSWNLEIHLTPENLTQWTTARGVLSTVHDLASSVTFSSQPYALELEVIHLPSAFVGEDLPVTLRMTNNDTREMELHLNVYLQTSDESDESTVLLDSSSAVLHENIPLGSLPPGEKLDKQLHLRTTKEGEKMIDLSLQSVTYTRKNTLSADQEAAVPQRVEEITKTIVVAAHKPFEVTTSVKYNYTREGGEAMVALLVETRGKRGVWMDDMKLEVAHGGNAKLLSSSLDNRKFEPVKWNNGSRHAISAVFAVPADSAGVFPPNVPGHLVFSWRSTEGPSSPLITSTHPLHPLHLPPTDSYILPVLHLPKPPLITPHQPFPLSLIIRNTHPTLTASLSLTLETADDFVWQGNRNTRLPPISPSEYREVDLNVVYLGKGGWVGLPKVMVWEGESEERESVGVLGSEMVLARA